MGSVFDFVLDGLEQALELERELGVRSIEIDRELLKVETPRNGEQPKDGVQPGNGEVASPPLVKEVPRSPSPSQRTAPPSGPQPSTSDRDFVFLHDRPLSEKGVEMMTKIIAAMGRTVETAPIVVAPPMPKARIVVVLGGLALKRYFPEMRGEPGQWQKTPEGVDVLITYSPEYILRFATVTPAVEKIKKDMWRSLKAVVQRLR